MHRAHSQAISACRIRDGILATPEEVTRALRALAEYLATVPEPHAATVAAPPETVTPWQCPRCGAAYSTCGRGGCASPGDCDGLCCDCRRGQARTHGQTASDPCERAVCGHCGWRGRMPTAPVASMAAPTAWAIRDTGGEWWLGGDGDHARWGSESDDARTFATFDTAEKWAEALSADGFDCFADRHPSAPDPRDARIADLEEQLRRRTCERDEAVSVSAEWRTERHEYARIAESYRQRVARLERVVDVARALIASGYDGPMMGEPVAELFRAVAALDRGAA